MIRDLTLKYCRDHFTKISEGTGRVVFNYDRFSVLKVAKNEAGRQQNINESRITDYSEIRANVIDSSEDFTCILMEKVIPYTKAEFEEVFGFKQDYIFLLMEYHYFKSVRENKTIFDSILKQIKEKKYSLWLFDEMLFDDRIKGVVNMMIDSSLEAGDLSRHKSWGKNTKGNPVLFDYGLSKHTWENYYQRTYKDITKGGTTIRYIKTKPIL